jgi:competence protein ComEA
MWRNNLFKQYFNFSKNETRGVLVTLVLIVLLYIIPSFFRPTLVTIKRDPVIEKQIQDLFDKDEDTYRSTNNNIPVDSIKMFAFDPNKIDSVTWRSFGISNKTIHTILNYRNKGGWFKDTGDIRKIWSIKKEDADRL